MTTTVHAQARPRRRRLLATLGRRWPTALAVGLAALLWGVDALTAARLLPVLPLLYVVAAVLRRRGLSWPLLAGSVVLFTVLDAQARIDPVLAVFALGLAVALAGLLRGGGRAEVVRQAGGLVLFVAVAALALVAAPEPARYLLAAGWLGHGVWDLVHLWRRRVVSPSYAEWCGVLDVLMAVQLLAVR